MRKIVIAITTLALVILLVACDYFKVERQRMIDYRHSDEWVEYYVFDDKPRSQHHDEKWEILWEITYADGHTEQRWIECTRFEYDEARKELGEVEP